MEETYVPVESSQNDDGSDSSADESGSEDSFSDDSFHPDVSGRYSDSHDCKKICRELMTRPSHIRGAKTKSTAARRVGEMSGVKLEYPSIRRAATMVEKYNALMAATDAANSTPDSEMVVMQPRQVERIFRVEMRRRWVAKHLTPETKKLMLRTKGKDWRATLNQKT